MNEERQFQIHIGILDDGRRLIGALKLQRWDVVKWAVTVNIAPTAAAIAFRGVQDAPKQLLWLAAFVAAIGEVLMLYYNCRLTNSRKDLDKTKVHLAAFDLSFVDSSKPPKFKGWLYDW
jgi:hypothetical protein